MDLDGSDSQYAHLLQPIKDLTKNWDVDIAAHLEDYLDELETITISFDGGETTMNFAQAAMLLQGSARVYSKKVEFLYSLVYQVLDMLANKKKQAQKSSVDTDGNDNDADFNNDNDDDDFLSLDDMQEGKNINLKEDFEVDEEFQLLPEIPLCLIPLEEGEKGENPLLSKKGEVLASRNDFKMNTCCIHPQGMLLLDMSHLKLLEQSLKVLAQLQNKICDRELITDIEIRNASEMNASPNHSGDDHHDDHDITDGAAGGSFQLANESVQEPMETAEVEVARAGLRRSERERRPVAAMNTIKPYVDPWIQSDGYEELKTGKPLAKKGCIQKLCPGLEDKTKKRKKKDSLQAAVNVAPVAKYLQKTCFSNTSKFPKNSMKVPTYADFDRLYWQEFKRRQACHKEQLKKQKDELSHRSDDYAGADDDDDDDHVTDDINPLTDVLDDDEQLVDDNLYNAIDAGMRCNQSFANRMEDRSWAETIEDGIIVNSYEDLVRKHVESYMASAAEYAQITELSKRVSEWEDKVLPRLEEEDTHEPFDINKYSTGVIHSLNKGNTTKFHNIVQGKPVFEICRTFLASLMLANTTNVRIAEKGATLADGMDKFELELLSTRRHYEELQEYQAPSLEK